MYEPPSTLDADPDEIVWIPVVPLPFMGVYTDKCSCGRRFRSFNRRKRRQAYEDHWRREHEHERDPDLSKPQARMGVTRREAERIYARLA